MQEHIRKRRKGTLPVNSVVIHKTLVLNRDKRVYKVLRYSVIGKVVRLRLVLIVIHPNAVEGSVKPLIFGIISVCVRGVNSRGKIKLKVVKIFVHGSVNHGKRIKQKGRDNNTYRDKSHKEYGKHCPQRAFAAAALFLLLSAAVFSAVRAVRGKAVKVEACLPCLLKISGIIVAEQISVVHPVLHSADKNRHN